MYNGIYIVERGDEVIQIAVCDDDYSAAESMERLLLDIQNKMDMNIEVSIFYSGESFVKAIGHSCPFDLILMDIEMAGMDGITAGSVLRGNDENDLVQLIYVSSHEEYHLQLFDVQPSGFIKKPIHAELFQQKIISILEKVLRKLQQGKKNFLALQQKGKEIIIPYRDIIYLESNKRRVILHTTYDQLDYYSTLNEEEKKLAESDFVRIHQSYIVNFMFIKEIRSPSIVLISGEILPISSKYNSAFKKQYLKFRGSLVG